MSKAMSELDMSNGMSEVEPNDRYKSKEITMSKSMSEVEANDISSELKAIETEIEELQEDFGDLGLDDDDQEDSVTENELDKLNAAIEGTVFEVSAAESSGELTILQMADGLLPDQSMQEGWGWVSKLNPIKIIRNGIKGRARRILNTVVRLVKKYRKLASCVPTVTIAVAAFKAGKYGTALKSSYSAYKCIRAGL